MAKEIFAQKKVASLGKLRKNFNRLLADTKMPNVEKAEKLLGEVRLMYNLPEKKDKAVALAEKIKSFINANKPGPETIVIC